MTGEEFFNLRRGSNVTVETPFGYFTKGQVFRVEYIDSINQNIYLRDTTKSLGDQVKMVDIFYMLEFFIVGGKLPNKKNDKVIELPFALGDKAWFLYNNTVYNGKIIDCNAQINSDGINIKYNLLFTSRCGENTATIASNKLFNTKEELLKSL